MARLSGREDTRLCPGGVLSETAWLTTQLGCPIRPAVGGRANHSTASLEAAAPEDHRAARNMKVIGGHAPACAVPVSSKP